MVKWILCFSESRNPFVEQAVPYAIAAAHALFDKDKKDALHKLLLQGNVAAYVFFILYAIFTY